MNRILLMVFALLVSAVVNAEVPKTMKVTYKVTYNGMSVGLCEERFEHDGKSFSIVSDIHTTGLASVLYSLKINREIHGTVTPTGLQPGSFVEVNTKKPRKSVQFDWPAKQVTIDSGKGPQTLPIPNLPIFDQGSFAWSFAFNPPTKKEGKIVLTDGRRLTEYNFAVIGTEKISTPIGKLEALHVKKIQESGDKNGFEVWLATSQHYLPARILFSDDHGTLDSVISATNLIAKP